jgi:heme oxygenase
MRILQFGSLAVAASSVDAFSVFNTRSQQSSSVNRNSVSLFLSAPVEVTGGFIETELRGQAMKLHTRSQAPKEGQASEKKAAPYTPTHDDYLKFLVDSQHIYKALEDVVNELDELTIFRNTGLERVAGLETDIAFIIEEYGTEKPAVGKAGLMYAEKIREMGKSKKVPEFMCHFYNFYFAHTAGGRMIGKQMSSLLLEKKTLEFYKVCYFAPLECLNVCVPYFTIFSTIFDSFIC